MPLPDTERRLFAASLGASFALHAAVLSVVPPLVRDDHPFEPPRVLSVLLSVVAPREEVKDLPAEPPPPPPPPKPSPRRAPPRPEIARAPPLPTPRFEPAPPTQRFEPAPVPTPAAEAVPPAPPGPPEPKQETPAAPPAPVVAARQVTTPPDYRAAYLRNPAPAYPAAARRSGEEGTVTLRVLVSAEGLPKRVALERSSGSGALDLAALQRVQQWRFVPARRGDEAREAEVLVPIVFRLEAAR